MSSLAHYLTESYQLLADSYQANCLTIARDIARLLLESGSRPFIVSLSKVESRGGDRFHYPLMPKKYGGRVTWTKHYVCCCGELAYDPMLEQPVLLDQYCQLVFGQDFPLEKFVAEEAMEEYLKRA